MPKDIERAEFAHKLEDATVAVETELFIASKKFPPFNSAHEGYAVLKEEVDEMWDAIKKNNIQDARCEAIQVAAMALRFLIDIRN